MGGVTLYFFLFDSLSMFLNFFESHPINMMHQMDFEVAYSEAEKMFSRNHIVSNQYTPYHKKIL